jgi:hypothetical protein
MKRKTRVPALGVLFARLQLGERLSAADAAGMVRIGASLALLSWHALQARTFDEPRRRGEKQN